MSIQKLSRKPKNKFYLIRISGWSSFIGLLLLLLAGCQSGANHLNQVLPQGVHTQTPEVRPTETPPGPTPTPLPTRPVYQPGEKVKYVAQSGDTLPALAAHFNTTVKEILEANPFIPVDATTMPPGMPMLIPIYYAPFWDSPYQIIPDSLFVNGPDGANFDLQTFVQEQPGWLASYKTYAAGENRSGANVVDYVATNFSVSPRLLLALLEYETGALTQNRLPSDLVDYPLGLRERGKEGVYLQLVVAANLLNNAYYEWRSGSLNVFDLQNGREVRPDPWQNAASVALQYYFAQIRSAEGYAEAVSPSGFAAVYRALFGDPWLVDTAEIPGSLQQPLMSLPFEEKRTWAYTGGPHTGWGDGEPLAAIDFAPPSDASGCRTSDEWATAVASGVISRVADGVAVLDLDGDGDERTGWVLFYLHLASKGKASIGTVLQSGDPIGHPSCEGGTSTGSHVHIARKYNGEWILAEGTLAFNLDGWIASNGSRPYLGTLTRFSKTIVACECANAESFISRDKNLQTK